MLLRVWQWLKGLSLAFFVIFFALSVAASAGAFVFQARHQGLPRKTEIWRTFWIVGSYAVLAILSLIFTVRRLVRVKRQYRAIPKNHMAIRRGEIPHVVRKFIESEYLRAAAIAYASQPPPRIHEGWGAPGSRYQGIHFRRAILDGLREIDSSARLVAPSMAPLKPHIRIARHLQPLQALIHSTSTGPAAVKECDAILEIARYSEEEPTEEEYEAFKDAVDELRRLFKAARIDTYSTLSNTSSDQLSFETASTDP